MVWEISWQEFLSMGGTIMVPLVAVALLLSYCIVERLLYFTALRRDDMSPDDVIGLLEKRSATLPEGSGLYRRMLTRFLSSKEIYGSIDIRVLEETNKGFLPELRKNFNLIACLITAAPLLGLLGTVTGMIHTFNVMNIFGTGNAKAMSSGISEAMITTQFGLVIAIVGLYAQLLIARRARRADLAVEELTRHIIRKFEL
jgi:biopolymer transport protein ExbB